MKRKMIFMMVFCMAAASMTGCTINGENESEEEDATTRLAQLYSENPHMTDNWTYYGSSLHKYQHEYQLKHECPMNKK